MPDANRPKPTAGSLSSAKLMHADVLCLSHAAGCRFGTVPTVGRLSLSSSDTGGWRRCPGRAPIEHCCCAIIAASCLTELPRCPPAAVLAPVVLGFLACRCAVLTAAIELLGWADDAGPAIGKVPQSYPRLRCPLRYRACGCIPAVWLVLKRSVSPAQACASTVQEGREAHGFRRAGTSRERQLPVCGRQAAVQVRLTGFELGADCPAALSSLLLTCSGRPIHLSPVCTLRIMNQAHAISTFATLGLDWNVHRGQCALPGKPAAGASSLLQSDDPSMTLLWCNRRFGIAMDVQ